VTNLDVYALALLGGLLVGVITRAVLG